MQPVFLKSSVALALACIAGAVSAQAIERVKPDDIRLDCAAIAGQQKTLADVVAAGDPNSPNFGKAAAGTAANMGGQVAGSVAAQSAGLFGQLGGLLSKAAGAVAQQQVEERMAPDAAAQQRAAEAKVRQGFLASLAGARECRNDDPSFAGKEVSAEQFKTLAEGPAAGTIKPLDAAAVQAVLAEPIAPLDTGVALDGGLNIAGKKLYISEFRVLFEVGGKVAASTRSGYLPGTSYGSTHSTINYKVAEADIAALQALTDKAWADLKERLAAAGVKLEDRTAFVAANGEVYAATEAASAPGAPVYLEENQGHVSRKFLVFAPAGMKLHSRGIAGLGAGDIGKRIDFVKNKLDGLSISVAVNIAALESSGSGSSILHRSGASTGAGEGMTISSPSGFVLTGHADGGSLRMAKGFAVPGNFARFREVGGYDSQKDAAVKAVQIAAALAGVAANKSKTVDMEVDLDGPATSRMALKGMATFNKAIADKLKAGLAG